MKQTNEKLDDPVIKVQYNSTYRRFTDGYRCRYYLHNLPQSVVTKVNQMMDAMEKKTSPIKNKYNNLRDKEVNAIEKPILKEIKKLTGVDF